ncbi:MAG: hypothetical protein ACFFDC_12665 [Promethearchaeota archaeon]
MVTDEEFRSKVTIFIISTIGAIIVGSTILHILYNHFIDEIGAALFLLIPAVYIGVLNEEIKQSMLSMVISIVGIIFLTSLGRSMPALIGIFPHSRDLFIFQQITETIPLIFLLVPFITVGTMIGVIINEFSLKQRY